MDITSICEMEPFLLNSAVDCADYLNRPVSAQTALGLGLSETQD
jgi:hypothetical protein